MIIMILIDVTLINHLGCIAFFIISWWFDAYVIHVAFDPSLMTLLG